MTINIITSILLSTISSNIAACISVESPIDISKKSTILEDVSIKYHEKDGKVWCSIYVPRNRVGFGNVVNAELSDGNSLNIPIAPLWHPQEINAEKLEYKLYLTKDGFDASSISIYGDLDIQNNGKEHCGSFVMTSIKLNTIKRVKK